MESNKKTPFQEWNFEALGFTELFAYVIVPDAVGIKKSEKAIFELAFRMAGTDISSSIFIGDKSVADIKGAKSAGMTTIYVPAHFDHDLCEYADCTFADLSELVGYIEREQQINH